jgi:transposase
LRSGAPWCVLPERGPYTTWYNRFVRWCHAEVWDRILAAITRYEKHAANFLAFVKLAAIRLSLRVYESMA